VLRTTARTLDTVDPATLLTLGKVDPATLLTVDTVDRATLDTVGAMPSTTWAIGWEPVGDAGLADVGAGDSGGVPEAAWLEPTGGE
jgi:hypothetical protein